MIKKILKLLWNDPVASKVIGGIITASLLGWLTKITIPETFNKLVSFLLSYKQALIVLCIVLVIWLTHRVIKEYKKPAFTKFCAINNICGYDWTWLWVYKPELKKWKMTNCSPLCKQCGEPLVFAGLYSNGLYQCVKGHKDNAQNIEVILAHNQIINYIKRQYPSEINKMDFSKYQG